MKDASSLSTVDALRELADRAAAQLVAESLQRLLGAPVTVTVHAAARVVHQLTTGRRPKQPKPAPKAKAAAAAPAPDALAQKVCRSCHRRGTATRVAGSDKAVKCSHCGFTWNARTKRAGSPTAVRATSADVCGRCEHDHSAHVGDGGKCLVPRCVCREFYQ